MKLLVVLGLLASACGAPVSPVEEVRPIEDNVQVIRSEFDMNHPSGVFRYVIELDNGNHQEVEGTEGLEGAIKMTGFYTLPDKNGEMVKVDWVADENGFRAVSPLIPELPPYVLEQIRLAKLNHDADQDEDVQPEQPAEPSRPSQPAQPSRPSQPPRPSQPSRPRPSGSRSTRPSGQPIFLPDERQ